MLLRSAAALAAAVLIALPSFAAESAELKTQKDKISYAIGLDMGKNLKKSAIDVDKNLLMRGIEDALAGGKPLMTDEQIKETFIAYQKERAGKAQKEGNAFLEANRKKKGVKTLSSGLQYTILKKGSGKSPKATDTVNVQYRGTLIDGTEFDSSYKRGKPATFQVNGVIPGWTEALQKMKEGGKWKLFIPPGLAYGERGVPGTIPPNSVLIFEVELLSIKNSK